MIYIDGPDDYRERGKTPPLPPEVVGGLSLIVGPDDGAIDNADVRVRWCVTPELTAHLVAEGVENPHVVLITCDMKGRNEWRGVFPLNELMTFARFYNAGTMKLGAYIIDALNDPIERRGKIIKWTKHDYESYNFGVQTEGYFFRTITDDEIYADVRENVVIPDGVFQKDPPAWLDWFVNVWHGKHKNDDGCEFRRRAFIAFTVKWIPMTIWAMIYWVVASLVLLAFAGLGLSSWIINLRPLLNPFDLDSAFTMMDTDEGEWGDLRDSKFVLWWTWREDQGEKKDRDTTITQPFYTFLPFSPTVFFVVLFGATEALTINFHDILEFYDAHVALIAIMLFLGGVALLFDICSTMWAAYLKYTDEKYYNFSHLDIAKGGALITVSTVAFIAIFKSVPSHVFMLICIAIVIVGLLIWLFNGIWLSKIGDNVANMIDRGYIWLYNHLSSPDDYTEMRELLCPKDKENLSTNIHNIPFSNLSWRLRYKNLRSMVCKPRQRR